MLRICEEVLVARFGPLLPRAPAITARSELRLAPQRFSSRRSPIRIPLGHNSPASPTTDHTGRSPNTDSPRTGHTKKDRTRTGRPSRIQIPTRQIQIRSPSIPGHIRTRRSGQSHGPRIRQIPRAEFRCRRMRCRGRIRRSPQTGSRPAAHCLPRSATRPARSFQVRIRSIAIPGFLPHWNARRRSSPAKASTCRCEVRCAPQKLQPGRPPDSFQPPRSHREHQERLPQNCCALLRSFPRCRRDFQTSASCHPRWPRTVVPSSPRRRSCRPCFHHSHD